MPAKKIHPRILTDLLPIQAIGWTTQYFLDWLDQTTDRLCSDYGAGWYWEVNPENWFVIWKKSMHQVVLQKIKDSPAALAEAAARMGLSANERIPNGVKSENNG